MSCRRSIEPLTLPDFLLTEKNNLVVLCRLQLNFIYVAGSNIAAESLAKIVMVSLQCSWQLLRCWRLPVYLRFVDIGKSVCVRYWCLPCNASSLLQPVRKSNIWWYIDSCMLRRCIIYPFLVLVKPRLRLWQIVPWNRQRSIQWVLRFAKLSPTMLTIYYIVASRGYLLSMNFRINKTTGVISTVCSSSFS